jgi:hypothetical protein
MLGRNLAQYREEKEKAAQAFAAVYEPAKAIFDEKCKTAGERIYKTAENVEGVLLLKIREQTKNYHTAVKDQMWSDAAVSGTSEGDGYILGFLFDRGEVNNASPSQPRMAKRIIADVGRTTYPNGPDLPPSPLFRGFRYVDVVDVSDASRYRITAISTPKEGDPPEIKLNKVPVTGESPRYAVTFENNVDPELRKHWIAGSVIKVIDTKTNEAMGELEVWRMDRSVGHTQWMNWETTVDTCPIPYNGWAKETHYFVDKILKAKQGN